MNGKKKNLATIHFWIGIVKTSSFVVSSFFGENF
jgi:hypothetical protein